MLALAIAATVLILTQPVPSKQDRSEGAIMWIMLNMVVSITTIWLFYAKLPA